jgi:hypothetical protein
MHSMNIAEWILALVTSDDRAASTAGDLRERAASHGVFWFWSSVLRTAISLLWCDITERPARFTGLAFLGLAVYIGIDLIFAGLSGVAFFLVAPLRVGSIGGRLWFTAPVVVSSLIIGRMLAQWAPRRELTACVVFAIVASIYNLVPMLGDNGAFRALLCILMVPVGAAWGHERRVRAT